MPRREQILQQVLSELRAINGNEFAVLNSYGTDY